MSTLIKSINVPTSVCAAIEKTMEELELPLSRIGAKQVLANLSEEMTVGDVAFLLRAYKAQNKQESRAQKLQKLVTTTEEFLTLLQQSIELDLINPTDELLYKTTELESALEAYKENLVGNLIGNSEDE